MLNAKLLQCNLKNFIKFKRPYISQAFKTVMDTPLKSSPMLEIERHNITPNAIEIDICVKRLTGRDELPSDFSEQLHRLRGNEEATKMLECTNFAVIRYFIETGNIQELLSIISNRSYYGIFLDNFTGCFLLNHLLKAADFDSSSKVAVELMIQEDLNHALLLALSMKSCYEFLKEYITEIPHTTPAVKNVITEKKVRVKYLQIHSNNGIDKHDFNIYMIGKTILKMANLCSNEIHFNMKILGHLLCNENKAFTDVIRSNPEMLCKDVLSICLALVEHRKDKISEEVVNIIKQLDLNHNPKNLDESLNLFLQKAIQKEESALIENQKKGFIIWSQDRESRLYKELQQRTKNLHQANIENALTDIDLQKEKLWFFELKDKIDLEIYRKKKIYPKRWFGKKKNAKSVDDHYVPPEVTKKYI